VARETLTSPELIDELTRQASSDSPAEFVVLIPGEPRGASDRSATVSPEDRMAAAQNWLRKFGVEVNRVTLGSHVPLLAIDREIQDHPGYFDAIIICTFPVGVSKWLRLDLPHQAQRRFGLPLTHVIAHSAPAMDEAASPCAHERLMPHWERVEEALHEEMALNYVCSDCGESLSPHEAAEAQRTWRP
jgi:hypothetical protein